MGQYSVLGWASWGDKKRAIVQSKKDKTLYSIWSNKRLRKILDCISPYFYCSDPTARRIVCSYIPTGKPQKYFRIEILPKKFFYNDSGRLIGYFPVSAIDENNYEDIQQKLEDLEKEEKDIVEQHRSSYVENVELPKEVEKYVCRDIPEGNYKIQRISKTNFRGAQKTYLHLVSLVDGVPVEEEEKIVSGWYIEEEWKRIEEKGKIAHPAICRLGIAKKMRTKESLEPAK